MVDIKDTKKFVQDLITFYKSYISGSTESIRLLAEIQEKFPDEYTLLLEIKNDPTRIEQITEELTEDEKGMLIMIFIRASELGRKIYNLFESSAEEKRKLANDLDNFSVYVDKKLTEFLEKRSKMEKKE